jgi:hypothetical protein
MSLRGLSRFVFSEHFELDDIFIAEREVRVIPGSVLRATDCKRVRVIYAVDNVTNA